jgi:ASCH domain
MADATRHAPAPADVPQPAFPRRACAVDEIRCLTVWQPYASAIIFGGKDVENRVWGTRYRGCLLIHAGMGVDWKAPAMAWTAAGLTPPPAGRLDRRAWLASLPRGRIIGTVVVSQCHHESAEEPRLSCSPWALPGQYHWQLVRSRPLADSVPCRGALRLWKLPEDAEHAVWEQLEAGAA